MKRLIFALSTLLLSVFFYSSASAIIDPSPEVASLLKIQSDVAPEVIEIPKTAEIPEVKPPKPVVYTVVEGDSLTSIATAYGVEWQRLWAKNTQLTNPDILNVGEQITIPFPEEELSRDIPTPIYNPVYTQYTHGIYGNTYSYGYCTFFVKNALPWVPNGWGNANQWAYFARMQGYTVSSTPIVGSVAQTSAGWAGHVGVVIGVGNGTILLQEMNYNGGWNVVSERTAYAWEFVYIYP